MSAVIGINAGRSMKWLELDSIWPSDLCWACWNICVSVYTVYTVAAGMFANSVFIWSWGGGFLLFGLECQVTVPGGLLSSPVPAFFSVHI